MKKYYTFLFCMCISHCFLYSQAILSADGPGSTYELITSVLAPGANPVEVPDCSHTTFGRHIEEVWDTDLAANVFAFHIHVSPDDDRCINFDRQRNEIKTYASSPDSLKGVLGETVTYKWKFKLDANFQPSNSFTHLHQIKAVGGSESAMPQITLTARAGNPEDLELRYAETTTQVTLATADLSLFKGVWAEVTETITYGEIGSGSYDLSIIKVSDGSSLFSYSDSSIRMWKTNADFMRPKWGIYRSLNNSAQLQDEIVYFADFSIEEAPQLAVTPSTLNFGAVATTLTFDITTNVAWTITENLSWLSLDVTSGFGTTTVTATVLQNSTGLTRTGNISIDEVTGGSNLSAIIPVVQLNSFQGSGEVIITEYHNRPLKPTQAQLDIALNNNPFGADTTPNEGHTEWFEIYNTTNAPVVMNGWTLTDASSSSNVSTIGSFTLGGGEYAVFSGFNIPDAQGGLIFDYFYSYKKPSFNNESSYSDPGDTACPDGVIIQKADGTLVDEVRYDYGYGEYIGNSSSSSSCSNNTAAIGIPPQNGSSKVSMMLNVDPAVMNAVDNDLASNWSYSTIVYDAAGGQIGTPGLANDGSLPPVDTGTGEVIITEIYNRPLKPTQTQLDAALPNNPFGADTSPNEGHTEWFEVYNTTNAPIVMDGWILTDASNSNSVSTISNFTLGAGQYAVFSGFNIPAAQGGVVFDYFYSYKKPSFNNESSYSDPGDTACPDGVIIQKADGTLVDEVRYDYGYGEYIGNSSSSSSCSNETAAIGFPPQNGSSKISMMLNVDPAVMNAMDNDLAANWSYSTIVYDPLGNQKGTPGLQNDGQTSCEADLILSGSNTTTGVKEAEFTITSTEQIGAGVTVDYSAGTGITLNPGFEVILGAVFHAYILGCQ